MKLTVAHINKNEILQDQRARALWEDVLKPKWDARAREEAEKLFAKTDAVRSPERCDIQA